LKAGQARRAQDKVDTFELVGTGLRKRCVTAGLDTRSAPARRADASRDSPGGNTAHFAPGVRNQENVMGKYFVGWLLGVPAIVLVVLWFFFR
jgi:hypothetical protein